jgi:hypothetical protein
MTLTSGATLGMHAKSTRNPRVMSLATFPDMTISMTMANGVMTPITDMYGFRRESMLVGLRIAMATGLGSPPGDGLGSKTSHGASLHFITGDGQKSATVGAGFRDQWLCGPFTRRPSWFLSADRDSACPWRSAEAVEESDGFRLVRARCMFRPTARANVTCSV